MAANTLEGRSEWRSLFGGNVFGRYTGLFSQVPCQVYPSEESPNDSLVDEKAETAPQEVTVSLEPDCFSLALVWELQSCWWVVNTAIAFVLPLGSAFVQFFVLYFLGMSHGNRFDDGMWLEPWSTNLSVNFMKIVTLILVCCKISAELLHCRNLCYALYAGDIKHTSSWFTGCWAMVLQYTMSIGVMCTAISVVLAAQSCTDAALKIFSVFIVVDIDNQVGKFLLHFVELDLVVKIKPSYTAYESSTRHRYGHNRLRFGFLVLPTVLSILLVLFCSWFNCIPLAVVKHGLVSNRDAPQMLVGRVDGCCGPARVDTQGLGDGYTVLFLGALREGHGHLHYVVPQLYWVVVGGLTPGSPSSLQVIEGRDADNNPALMAGHMNTSLAQAGVWLEEQGYPHTTYGILRDEEQLGLAALPYTATFQIDRRRLAGVPAYQVFVVAQNPRTRALASVPAASPLVRIKQCATGCLKCDEAGAGRCDPESCAEGFFVGKRHGHCLECPANCVECKSARKCKRCRQGFSLDVDGVCQPCAVANCRRCLSSDMEQCDDGACEEGFDLAQNGTCHPCSDPHCAICKTEGTCESCLSGWGLQGTGKCGACPHGCKDCVRADDPNTCTQCAEGFAIDKATRTCQRCMEHCIDCESSGLGSCTTCRTGYGFNKISLQCIACMVDHCELCTGDGRCSECELGYGVTTHGVCDRCGKFCKNCGAASSCEECQPGYAIKDGDCHTCADRCMSCGTAGPGKCDECFPGFRVDSNSKTCVHHGHIVQQRLRYSGSSSYSQEEEPADFDDL